MTSELQRVIYRNSTDQELINRVGVAEDEGVRSEMIKRFSGYGPIDSVQDEVAELEEEVADLKNVIRSLYESVQDPANDFAMIANEIQDYAMEL